MWGMPAQANNFFDSDLWSKYRVALIQILQHKFPALAEGVGLGKSSFHIVSTPEEANWHRDKSDLNENFAKYAIKFDATFDYIAQTEDRSVPKLYESMVMKCKNPQAFSNFKNAATESFPQKGIAKSYPWVETKTKLADFYAANANKAVGAVHFIVESSKGQTTINNPWETIVGPVVNSGGFVKEFNVNNDDDDALFDLDFDEDTFLFRRRRRSAPPPQIQTTIIKSERFKVEFKARGVDGITINPGPWFDRNFIRQNAGNLQEFFGKNGKLPILPKVVWVAQNPHVVVELSESEWHKFQNVWKNPRTIGMSIGGSFFRTNQFAQKVKDDDDASPAEKEFYNNEDNAPYFADSVTFTVSEEDRTIIPESSAQVSEYDNEYDLDLLEEDDIDEDNFLFRRRRRSAPPPPPPKPIVVHEKVYRAEFKSNDPRPQIIAVTGEILP